MRTLGISVCALRRSRRDRLCLRPLSSAVQTTASSPRTEGEPASSLTRLSSPSILSLPGGPSFSFLGRPRRLSAVFAFG